MGARENDLTQALSKYFTSGNPPSRITLQEIQEFGLYDEVKQVYMNLGGILSEVPISCGPYDVTFNEVVIEIDEEMHFNRYRAVTLEAPFYNKINYFNVVYYKAYCNFNESKCLKRSHGGYWTNSSCEKQFGEAAPLKILDGNGSPRWKQRAFYDFIKDINCFIKQRPFVRLSIYDNINVNGSKKQLEQILGGNIDRYSDYIYQHIKNFIPN